MNPITAISTSLVRSFTYRGRAGRSEFWWFQAVRVVAALAFLYALGLLLQDFVGALKDNFTFDRFQNSVVTHRSLLMITSCLILVLLPASYASSVRRLHDRGHPGWPLWTVFIAAFSQFYVYLLILAYLTIDPVKSIAWTEGLIDTLITLAESGGGGSSLLAISGAYVVLSVVAICLFAGPLYFIFFTVQACLPSVETENRHGPAPHFPSHNEVFQ